MKLSTTQKYALRVMLRQHPKELAPSQLYPEALTVKTMRGLETRGLVLSVPGRGWALTDAGMPHAEVARDAYAAERAAKRAETSK